MVYEFGNDEYLAHHGVDGQKWGVQHGPPYPLSRSAKQELRQKAKEQKRQQKEADKQYKKADSRAKRGYRDEIYRQKHTIPAGTTMYRVTSTQDANADGMTYVTYLTPDRTRYRAGWIRQIGGTGEAYEHRFTLKKDLVVPSREELTAVCEKIVRKNQANIDKTIWGWLDYNTNGKAKQEVAKVAEEQGKSVKQLLKGYMEDIEDRYVGYSYLWIAQSLGTNTDVKKQIVSELKRRGYNAMVDEAGVGGHARWSPDGIDPLIIFNGSDTLEEKGMSKVSRGSEGLALSKTLNWEQSAYRGRDSQHGAWSAL